MSTKSNKGSSQLGVATAVSLVVSGVVTLSSLSFAKEASMQPQGDFGNGSMRQDDRGQHQMPTFEQFLMLPGAHPAFSESNSGDKRSVPPMENRSDTNNHPSAMGNEGQRMQDQGSSDQHAQSQGSMDLQSAPDAAKVAKQVKMLEKMEKKIEKQIAKMDLKIQKLTEKIAKTDNQDKKDKYQEQIDNLSDAKDEMSDRLTDLKDHVQELQDSLTATTEVQAQ